MHANSCNYTDGRKKKEKESHCKMGSSCGLAVALLSTADGAGFILFHRQEERNPREETSVRPTQGKKKTRLYVENFEVVHNCLCDLEVQLLFFFFFCK